MKIVLVYLTVGVSLITSILVGMVTKVGAAQKNVGPENHPYNPNVAIQIEKDREKENSRAPSNVDTATPFEPRVGPRSAIRIPELKK